MQHQHWIAAAGMAAALVSGSALARTDDGCAAPAGGLRTASALLARPAPAPLASRPWLGAPRLASP